MSCYLVMRSKDGTVNRIEVDSDEFCQDHRDNPPLFHRVERQVDGRPYVFAVRCPSSLTEGERSRLFSSETPLSKAVATIKARDESETDGKRRVPYQDLTIALLAVLLAAAS